LVNALALILPGAVASDSSGFEAPSINEFYPAAVLFQGTPFEMNRIMLIRVLICVVLVILFSLWAGKFKKAVATGNVVPGRFQLMGEISLDFVRKSIAHDQLGEKDGNRFLPLLTAIFFTTLGMNITGIIPGLNIAGTSLIGLPIVMALTAYVTFIYAGIRAHGAGFFKSALLPSGVPPFMMPLITVIEFASTFVLRPITLSLRLTMNMIAGHLLLVLCMGATSFFLIQTHNGMSFFGAGTFAFSFIFSLFELLVAFLQAYVFTLLTTVYIQLALADEH